MTVREEIIERLRSLDPSRRADAVDELLRLLLADPEGVLSDDIKRKIEELRAESNDLERLPDRGRDR